MNIPEHLRATRDHPLGYRVTDVTTRGGITFIEYATDEGHALVALKGDKILYIHTGAFHGSEIKPQSHGTEHELRDHIKKISAYL